MRRFLAGLAVAGLMVSGVGLVVAGEAPPGIDEPLRTGLTAPGDVAVVIGNEKYGKITGVPYAKADAAAFETFLKYTRGVPMDRIRSLQDASKETMMEAVQEMAARKPTGIFWIYYAGHGMGDPNSVDAKTSDRLLLGWDAEGAPTRLAEKGISVKALQAAAAAGGGQVVMVVDACYNGGTRTDTGSGASLANGARIAVPESLVTHAGVVEWAASAPTQLAMPLASVGHGAFTYMAIGALRGWADGERSGSRDGVVTLEEAQLYVQKQFSVMQLTSQQPQVGGAAWDTALSGRVGARLEAGPSPDVVRGLAGNGGPAQSSISGSGAGTGQAEVILTNTGPVTPWTAEDDAILASQEAKVRRAAKEKAAAAQEADAAQRVKARQSAVAAEWAQLEAVMDAPEQAGAEERAVVAVKVARWKADSVEVPGQRVPLTGSVAWNGRTISLDGKYEEVAAKKVTVDNSVMVAKAEAWMRRVPAAAAVSVSTGGSASTGGGDWMSPTLGKMKWIPAGTFTMGSPAGEVGRGSDERQHQVTLTKGFWMMEAEVTQAQWIAVTNANPSVADYKGVSLRGGTLPVQNVSWEDIQGFIQKISARDGVQYRLPTEAEWEYAARAGTAMVYAGTNEAGSVCQYGNMADVSAKEKWGDWSVFSCNDGYPGLAPVKSFRPNAWGLYDMTGNVWEWVQDRYDNYPGTTSDYVSSKSNKDSDSPRIYRGGSWFNAPSYDRVAYRGGRAPVGRDADLGFRLAISARMGETTR